MIAFEININGNKICTAGIDSEFGTLTSVLSWAKRDISQLSEQARKNIPEEELKLSVGGQRKLGANENENLQWLGCYVNPGDEISIKILETYQIDQPKIINIKERRR